MTVETQPLSSVEWVSRDELHANDYNPNIVAPRELKLLKLSIMEDGWTQPIVARRDGQIVDGFHRWTVAEDPAIAGLTGGLVPVVRLDDVDPVKERMATIRHNRARGSHYVVRMADIIATLVEEGVPDDEIMRRLGMEAEEVRRLVDRGDMREQVRRGEELVTNNHGTRRHPEGEAFSRAWTPVYRDRDAEAAAEADVEAADAG